MIDQKIHIFIDGVVNYFKYANSGVEATVGSPYLIDSVEQIGSDYTGRVSVSGAYEGFCCFTAPTILLKHLIMSLGESDTSDEMVMDAVGEVANILSGNAREHLGKDFIISVPEVIRGKPYGDSQCSEQRVYAIPINWKSYRALLAVCLYQ